MKEVQTTTSTNMIEISSSEKNPAMTAREIDVTSENEARILTQVDVSEQIRTNIAPLT